MPTIVLKDPRAKIVTCWNGEAVPRQGVIGDTKEMETVPDFYLKNGRCEIVHDEPKQFITNPDADPRDELRAEYELLTETKPDGRWSADRLREEINGLE